MKILFAVILLIFAIAILIGIYLLEEFRDEVKEWAHKKLDERKQNKGRKG